MKGSKVTIITINYNNCDGLRDTIRSVAMQTYRTFEYVIIDGGSTDGSVEVIKNNADLIDYWVSESDRGIYHAMNKGIEQATGEYCLFLNSGDVFCNNNILECAIKNGLDKDLVIGGARNISSGEVFFVHSRPFVFMDFWYKSTIPHPSTFIKRSLFDDNKYDEELKIVSDWKFFINAIFLKKCSYKKMDLLIVDFDGNGVSSKVEDTYEEHRKVLVGMLPEIVYTDYEWLANGRGYDSFFLRLRYCKYSQMIYAISLWGVRLLSICFSSARFARLFHLNPLKR